MLGESEAINVTTLLSKYRAWVSANRIQFIPKTVRKMVIRKIDELSGEMKKMEEGATCPDVYLEPSL